MFLSVFIRANPWLLLFHAGVQSGRLQATKLEMMATPRPLTRSFTLMLATVSLGLAVRFAPLGLPGSIVKYGGSALWALTIYWVVSTLLSRWRLLSLVLISGSLATAVECFKLYRSPGMDAFRRTLPGVLLLGRYFSARDIAAYWIAIGLGAWVDARLRQRES